MAITIESKTDFQAISGLTAGSILFAGSTNQITQNNSKLFWDNTNNRLGLGNTSPAQLLSVGSSTVEGVGIFDSPTGSGNGPVLDFATAGIVYGQIGLSSGLHNNTVTDLELASTTNIKLAAGSNYLNIDTNGLITGLGTSLGASTGWTPVVTGYTNAGSINLAHYIKIGKLCFIAVDISGTSNSTSFSFTLPFAAGNGNTQIVGDMMDGGSWQADAGWGATTASSTSLTLIKDGTEVATTWTNSGTKRVIMSGWYETT